MMVGFQADKQVEECCFVVFRGCRCLQRTMSQRTADRVGGKGSLGSDSTKEKMQWQETTLEDVSEALCREVAL